MSGAQMSIASVAFSQQETAQILAALRWWQVSIESLQQGQHFGHLGSNWAGIHQFIFEGEGVQPLDMAAIDNLCERINMGGAAPEDDGTPGQCLTCGTQCGDEGICPACSRLEAADGLIATASRLNDPFKEDAMLAGLRLRSEALAAVLGGCAKCGMGIALGHIHNGFACVDQGEGPEAGKVFAYCSTRCREAH